MTNAAEVNRSFTENRKGCKHLFWESHRHSGVLNAKAQTIVVLERRNLDTSILSWAAQCSRAYYTLPICLKCSDCVSNVGLLGPWKASLKSLANPERMHGSQIKCQPIFFIRRLNQHKLELNQDRFKNEKWTQARWTRALWAPSRKWLTAQKRDVPGRSALGWVSSEPHLAFWKRSERSASLLQLPSYYISFICVDLGK